MKTRGDKQAKKKSQSKKSVSKRIAKLVYLENYHPKMLEKLDKLYQKSSEGKHFYKLMDTITSEENIMLAVRNIKANKGKNTKGTNETTMQDLLDKNYDELIADVRGRFADYKPQTIRRVFIPKSNGKQRPLGIPTMEERLLQQCIYQVLDPIAEAKFIKHSYAFRPHRSNEQAIARTMHIMNNSETCNYVVNIDIKAYFDNVNHSKLIKQLHTMGIRDKPLLTIIKKMLKAKVVEPSFGIITPEKGTPQGGILSPLLSNIVLNEFDHWITTQWEDFKTNKTFTGDNAKGNAMRDLRQNSKLKRMRYVRFADDFRIFTKTKDEAERIYHATKQWLKERLGLDISEEKSEIIDLKRKNMEFLGILFKLVPNKNIDNHEYDREANHFVAKTSISKKKKEQIKERIRKDVKKIKYTFQHDKRMKAIKNFNSYIRGLEYYSLASTWCKISSRLTWDTRTTVYNRLKRVAKTRRRLRNGETAIGEFKRKRSTIILNDVTLLTPNDVKHKTAEFTPKGICKYTERGRKVAHNSLLRVDVKRLEEYLNDHPNRNETAEFNDNRLSALSAQKGLCRITGLPLQIGEFEIHHIIPVAKGGTSQTVNLLIVNTIAHDMIHTKETKTLNRQIQELIQANQILDMKKFIGQLNKYRKKVGNEDYQYSETESM